MDRKEDKSLSTTSKFYPLLVVLELVWSSTLVSIIPKIGKLQNLFSPISLVGYHFINFSLKDLSPGTIKESKAKKGFLK